MKNIKDVKSISFWHKIDYLNSFNTLRPYVIDFKSSTNNSAIYCNQGNYWGR